MNQHGVRDSEVNGFIHKFIRKSGKWTILVLHGTGGNEHDLIPLAEEIDSDDSILSVRGKVLENGMPRYFRRLSSGIFDLEDLRNRTFELANFIELAGKKYEFEPKSVIALGYSNGANIAASILFLKPETLKGAVLLRAMVPFTPEALPNLSQKRIFLSSGKFDPIIPRLKVMELAELLQRAHAQITMNWEESDHSLTQEEIQRVRNWVRSL